MKRGFRTQNWRDANTPLHWAVALPTFVVLAAARNALPSATLAGLMEAWMALFGVATAVLLWKANPRDAVEYWTHVPGRGGTALGALLSTLTIAVIGGLFAVIETQSIGPLAFGWLFFFGTALWAERSPRRSAGEGPADRHLALPGTIGVLVLLVRAWLAPDEPPTLTWAARNAPGLFALAAALATGFFWKRGRATWGTDRLRVRR